jgi:mannosyltransferase
MLIYCAATGEPEGILWRAEDNDYAPDSTESARINATLLSLVRNEELNELVKTMRDLERTWNNKFNYPWTFMNDQPFTEEFKRKTQEATKAKCYYGTSLIFYLYKTRRWLMAIV